MNKIFINIKELCGILENQEKPLGGDEANSLKIIKNAYLEIVDGKIASYGKMDDLEVSAIQEIIDAKDKSVNISYPSGSIWKYRCSKLK